MFLAIGGIFGSFVGIALVAASGAPYTWPLRLLAIWMIVVVGANL